MADIPELVKRRMVSDDLRGSFEATIEQRVDRYIEVSHQPMTSNPHFAAASAECIGLYTDGHFLSTVMVTQAVAEGLRKFILECNGIRPNDGVNGEQIGTLLVEKKIMSEQCAEAFNRIYRSFRNDVHHMNPKVGTIDFPDLSRKNIQDLATIEREIFAFKMSDKGEFILANPQYWDIRADGRAAVFLRLSP